FSSVINLKNASIRAMKNCFQVAKLMPARFDPAPSCGLVLNRQSVSLGIQNGPDLLEKFAARVRLWDEAAQSAVEHIAQLHLFGKTTAQDNVNIGIQGFQLIEDGVAVHDRQEIVKNDERDP